MTASEELKESKPTFTQAKEKPEDLADQILDNLENYEDKPSKEPELEDIKPTDNRFDFEHFKPSNLGKEPELKDKNSSGNARFDMSPSKVILSDTNPKPENKNP